MELFEAKTPYSIEFYPGQNPLVLRMDYVFPHEKVTRANFAAMYKMVLDNSHGELVNADLQLRMLSVMNGFNFKPALQSYSRWGGFANVISRNEKALLFPEVDAKFIAHADTVASVLASQAGFSSDRYEDIVLQILAPAQFNEVLRNEHERLEHMRYLHRKYGNGIRL